MMQTKLGLLGLILMTASANAQPVEIAGVDQFKVCEPNVEAMRIALSFAGENYSTAYLQGISTNAFRIAGPCPCAPTCWGGLWPEALAKLLGYEVEVGRLTGEGDARKASWEPIHAQIKDALRAGKPVVVWSAFTSYEWDIVCGFDDETGEFIGRGSYPWMQKSARAVQDRSMEFADVTSDMALFLGAKTGAFNAREAELDALKEAVAYSQQKMFTGKELPAGLEAYDGWINTLRQYEWLGSKSPGQQGAFYCLSILSGTRLQAATFMREIAPKYPEAVPHFDLAADFFDNEAKYLHEAFKVISENSAEVMNSSVKRAQMAGNLTAARAMYALAMDEISRGLQNLNDE